MYRNMQSFVLKLRERVESSSFLFNCVVTSSVFGATSFYICQTLINCCAVIPFGVSAWVAEDSKQMSSISLKTLKKILPAFMDILDFAARSATALHKNSSFKHAVKLAIPAYI